MRRATRHAIIVLAVLALTSAWADTRSERIAEGVRLHDQKDFEAAMVVYREVLKDHPHDPIAVYEMAFSWVSSRKNLQELTTFIESELASGVVQQPALVMMLGQVYDELGQYKNGEAAIRRAVAAAPDDAMSHYNLGVNLRLQKRFPEATDAYCEALKRKSDYASAWIGLGATEKDMDRPERALFALARAVALEPESARGRDWAAKLPSLLFARVEQKAVTDATQPARKEITISISGTAQDDSEDDGDDVEGPAPDVAALESLVGGMTAALRHTEEWEKKSDAAFFVHAIESLTKAYAELPDINADPYWSIALPWFMEVNAAGHSQALGYSLLRSAGDKEAIAWSADHSKQVQAFRDWMSTGR